VTTPVEVPTPLEGEAPTAGTMAQANVPGVPPVAVNVAVDPLMTEPVADEVTTTFDGAVHAGGPF
jgi:hypothetical protein